MDRTYWIFAGARRALLLSSGISSFFRVTFSKEKRTVGRRDVSSFKADSGERYFSCLNFFTEKISSSFLIILAISLVNVYITSYVSGGVNFLPVGPLNIRGNSSDVIPPFLRKGWDALRWSTYPSCHKLHRKFRCHVIVA